MLGRPSLTDRASSIVTTIGVSQCVMPSSFSNISNAMADFWRSLENGDSRIGGFLEDYAFFDGGPRCTGQRLTLDG